MKNETRSSLSSAILNSYFPGKNGKPGKPPVEVDWPVPEACWPKGEFEACPWPVLDEVPPLAALEMASPVADTPPGPALPVPIPAPVPAPIGAKTAPGITAMVTKC